MTATITRPREPRPAFRGAADLSGGRFPPISLVVTPLASPKDSLLLDRFVSYSFESSITIPVDSFQFGVSSPDDPPVPSFIKEGDVATLFGNKHQLGTGILDVVEVDCGEAGELATITGRDLMGQLEDNDAVSVYDDPIWGKLMTMRQVADALCASTRIAPERYRLAGAPVGGWLFATEPGESKMAALLRYLEPLNVLAWMDQNGHFTVGRPNFGQASSGTLVYSRDRRRSNCQKMKVTYASATIPNIVLPVWAGQETTLSRVPKRQRLYNAAAGPDRLRKLNHRLAKAIVWSAPNAGDKESLMKVNQILASVKAGEADFLLAMAQRMIARENTKERGVYARMAGHYNGDGAPFRPDTVYDIDFDRGGVKSPMYLHKVRHSMALGTGQITELWFCNLWTTLVARAVVTGRNALGDKIVTAGLERINQA